MDYTKTTMLLPSAKYKTSATILEQGFLLSKKKWPTALLLSFLGVACISIGIFIKMQLPSHAQIAGFMLIINIVASQVFLGGLIFFLYNINKNLPCSLKTTLIEGIQKLPALFVVFLLYSLLVFIGTVAFIIPGLLLSILWVFGFILIYTDNHDPLLALTSSYRISKNHLFSIAIILFILCLFVILANLLSLMLGYLLFISLSLSPISLLVVNISLLTLVNSLIIPTCYGIMIILLQELKLKQIFN